MRDVEGNRDHRRVERQFFTLLRSGLWNEVPDRSLFDSGDTDWEALYRLAFEQTSVGIVTDGINRLPKECLPAEPERLDPFLGDMLSTARRNAQLDAFIPRVFKAQIGRASCRERV